MSKAYAPITPGKILKAEFLDPLGISQYRLAQATGLPATRIGEIVRGKRRITPAIRLSRSGRSGWCRCAACPVVDTPSRG